MAERQRGEGAEGGGEDGGLGRGRGKVTGRMGNWVVVGHRLGTAHELIVVTNTVFQVGGVGGGGGGGGDGGGCGAGMAAEV